tara:strand:+ start:749 stop:1132 length:384 start_codon:yes stop_codon:yes gene_type:complete
MKTYRKDDMKPPTKIAIWEFPDGPAQSEDQQNIVLKQTRAGDFRDCYIANLLDGDRYMVKQPIELPPRTDTCILDFIISNQIKVVYGDSDIYVYRRDRYLFDHPYSDETKLDDVRDAMQYMMDMDEL